MKLVASFHWGTLFAERAAEGGLVYFNEAKLPIVNMVGADLRSLQFITNNHNSIDKIFDQLEQLKEIIPNG